MNQKFLIFCTEHNLLKFNYGQHLFLISLKRFKGKNFNFYSFQIDNINNKLFKKN
jgi:hypothetical protein